MFVLEHPFPFVVHVVHDFGSFGSVVCMHEEAPWRACGACVLRAAAAAGAGGKICVVLCKFKHKCFVPRADIHRKFLF